MFKILVAVIVLLGATCCYGTAIPSSDSYKKLNKVFDEYMLPGKGMKNGLKSTFGRFVKAANSDEFTASLDGLSRGHTCSEDSLENLKRVVEIALKHDEQAFTRESNKELGLTSFVLFKIDQRSRECIELFANEWKERGTSEDFKSKLDELDASDVLVAPGGPFVGRDLLESALEVRNSPSSGRKASIDAVNKKSITEECSHFISRYDVKSTLKPMMILSSIQKLVKGGIDYSEDPDKDDLYKWTSRYVMCELIEEANQPSST